ncbi:MAG TPA: fused MFS/spermidine synthase [Gemmatimonadaceae bacterium]|nr:fused MFS/spermidine synthase [Gemmatimonadaceae bacterium]
MNNSSSAAAMPATHRYLPLLLVLFVGSGCAALIYEIVWFEMLQLSVGSSAVSLGVLLGTFMAGMCIGSLMLSRLISRDHHPLKVYAALELGVGVFGLLALVLLPIAGSVYLTIAGHGMPGFLLRGVVAAICLLPPTFAMGATLPAIARWVETTPRGVSWLGFFYGGNTAGAVIGCVLTGFYLLRVTDVQTTTFVAVAINIAVAGIAFYLSKVTPANAGDRDAKPASVETAPGTNLVYATIALSGMTALGAEVVWTRLFTLLLGGTTYTFSIILAVFLIGIGLGSSIGSFAARQLVTPRHMLGAVQVLLMAAIAWTAWQVTQELPYWPTNPELTIRPWFQFQIDFVRCAWAILPGAILWGASFPLALASVASPGQDAGRMVGRVYAANTVGAIVGALFMSLVMVAWVGTQHSQQVLIGLAALGAALMLLPQFVGGSTKAEFGPKSVAFTAVILVCASVFGSIVKPPPALLVAYGRFSSPRYFNHGDFVYFGEGMNSSPAVSVLSNGVVNYHNAGKVQASSEPQDMRLQRMLGHFTTLVPEHPNSVLVIGCGAGVTAGAVSISPLVQKVTIAEIEPLVPQVASKYFGQFNYNVVTNPKVHIQIDDARHFLGTTEEKFDAITSDPFDPWVKGAANLYTKEFWQLAKSKLNPGGVVTVFVQLYEAGTPAVKSEVASFLAAFPDGIVWANNYNGAGYDVVLMGRASPGKIDVDSMAARLADPKFAVVAQSLREIGINSAIDLLGNYTARAPELKDWLADAQLNLDKNLRLQYLAGLGLNKYEQAEIYNGMARNRAYPEDLFTGSPPMLAALRAAIGRPQ